MRRLARETLATLPRAVRRPGYDPREHGVGIMHLGIGAFHRAHQAVYTDSVLETHGGDWRIAGVSLRGDAVAEQLNPQDGLFAVNVRSAERSAYRIVASVDAVLPARRDARAVLERLCAPATKIVSLTVTEKGYCHDPATGALNVADPDVAGDRERPDAPRTAVGFLVAALRERRARGRPPFTVLCCDNLPHNGPFVRGLVVQFAELLDATLAEWIDASVAFPSTMVDRIVPPTTQADLDEAARELGIVDLGLVVTEPFSQWVIEDRFGGERPRWEAAGAELVDDVAPYELAKLRLLNGSHSALAYLGYLAGATYVHEAMQDAGLADFIAYLMREEIAPTLAAPPGLDLARYGQELLARLRNPALKHRTWQIAMDGSQKLPPRLLGTVRDRLAARAPWPGLALALAAWARYVGGVDERGVAIDVRDPLRDRLAALARAHAHDPHDWVVALVGVTEIFGTDLRERPEFVDGVADALRVLLERGARAALRGFRTRAQTTPRQ